MYTCVILDGTLTILEYHDRPRLLAISIYNTQVHLINHTMIYIQDVIIIKVIMFWVVYLTMQAKVAVDDYYGARTFYINTINKWTEETKDILSVRYSSMPRSNLYIESKAALTTKAVGA